MRFVIIALLVLGAICTEMLVTKEYTDYLKRHVSWEVVDYEENIFRGWTMEEAKVLLGLKEMTEEMNLPEHSVSASLPSAVNWAGASCDHGVKNQGNCGSCWAFATAGMLSDRCCINGNDKGWLSPQELVSCDPVSEGCNGGWCTWALDYVKTANGLVPWTCFDYKARDLPCPNKCDNGDDWKGAHVCSCNGGYSILRNIDQIKTALADGPVTLGFGVCRSFFNYRGGIYKCDCGGNYAGLHAVLGVGFGSTPECFLHVRNSWGTNWGVQGYFDIGCGQCGIAGTYPNGNVCCKAK